MGRLPSTIVLKTLLLGLLGTAAAAVQTAATQREFREYPPIERDAWTPLPADYRVPGEFVVGRLMYPTAPEFALFGGMDWTRGGTAWTVDYPLGDRTFARILRRLTRLSVRSVEQPVNLDDGDDVYDWPFLIVGLPGMWDLSDAQAAKLRDYLLRGGFLLCDSFFGTREWTGFLRGIQKLFPDRPLEDLKDDDPVFHTVYDLNGHEQVPNWDALQRGVPYRADGVTPHWRGIRDDRGRVMVAIAFNNDLGDSWQWADDAGYPEHSASFGLRMGVNLAVYDLTH